MQCVLVGVRFLSPLIVLPPFLYDIYTECNINFIIFLLYNTVIFRI
nr:MAG TPA: hypothetical protein [Caudoviricetes sp.]